MGHAAVADLPSMDSLKKSREKRLHELKIEALLKECLVYVFFILVLYFISYQERDKRSYLFAQNIKNIFFYSALSPAFGDVSILVFQPILCVCVCVVCICALCMYVYGVDM